MSDFTERIRIKGRGNIIFDFIKVNKMEGADYFITLKITPQPISFRMRNRGGVWRIVDAPKVPDWIMEIETLLSDAIKKKDS